MIKIQDIRWKLECLDEDIPIRGNAICTGDSKEDKEIEDNIIEELEYNPWAWCCVRLTGYYKGLEASDYLGGCSYKSEKDFIENSGYYYDMQARILEELEGQLEELLTDIDQEALDIIKALVDCPDYKGISTHQMRIAKEFLTKIN